MNDKMRTLIKQLFFFGIVGGICFVIDLGLLMLLTDLAGLHYLVSSIISFTVSCIVNYILSMKLVFVRKDTIKPYAEFLIFVVLSVIGLGLTELLMWLGADCLSIDYRLCKIVTTLIVMVFNFVTKKIALSKK